MRQGAKKAVPKKATAREADLPYRRELAERISTAFKQYNARQRSGQELTQEDLGRLVAKRMGTTAPTQAAVSLWMNVNKPSAPSNLTLAAIADVLDVDPMWLILGAKEE
jgi:hypothetical protein